MLGDQSRTLANGKAAHDEVGRALAHILERARYAEIDRIHGGNNKYPPAIAAARYFHEFPHPTPLELEVLDALTGYILSGTEVDVVVHGHRWNYLLEGHVTDADGRVIRLDLGVDK